MSYRMPMKDCGSDSGHRHIGFHVVGIGASAGGLDALIDLFRAIPPQSGHAFVVLLHSTPGHETLLAEILASKTSLPAIRAEPGYGLKPDQIHVAYPGLTIVAVRGAPVFSEGRSERGIGGDIDFLFESIAANMGTRSVGIILSGMGDDGARGLRAIAAAGGMCMAQAADSAAYKEMPVNAASIMSEKDILSPVVMAARLSGLKAVANVPYASVMPQLSETQTKKMIGILRDVADVDFTNYKRTTILRRLARRMSYHHLSDPDSYLEILARNPSEAIELRNDFLIGVTGFFREPENFQSLVNHVFPRILEKRQADEVLRIWVPGCSTGEEAYSIAMILSGHPDLGPVPKIIFGTDINEQSIEKARSGFYRTAEVEGIDTGRLQKFFIPVEGGYQIASEVRKICVFARHDIIHDPPFSKIDLISCCNLLIYFDKQLHGRMANLFHYALKSRGFLSLGLSENLGQHARTLFTQIDRVSNIYLRLEKPVLFWADYPMGGKLMMIDVIPPMTNRQASAQAESMAIKIDRLLLDRYGPAGMVLDEHQNILQFTGRLEPFLEVRSGPAGLALDRLCSISLRAAISACIHDAQAKASPVRRDRLSVKLGEVWRFINIEVTPLEIIEGQGKCSLVVLENDLSSGAYSGSRRWGGFWGSLRNFRFWDKSGKELELLQDQLESTQVQLKSIFDAYEITREELKSSEDELLSAREEFLSTNEELQTAKEELQSTNEELMTANDELRARNIELSQAVIDVREADEYAQAIVDNSHVAMLVIDRDFRIRRCNRLFSEILGIQARDVEGRVLLDIAGKLGSEKGFLDNLSSIIRDGQPIRNIEIVLNFPAGGRQVLLLNASLLTGQLKSTGLVLVTLLDITEAKGAEATLRQQAELLNQTHEPIFIWSLESGIRYWSRGAEELYGWQSGDVIGLPPQELLKSQRQITYEQFERQLKENREWVGEVCHFARDGRKLVLECRSRVSEQPDGSLLVLEADHDITERKKIEASLRQVDRMKDEFIAMLAHELRNPLAPLRNALAIMQRAKPGEVGLDEMRAMMDRQVTKLTRIVDDLLDMARITRGKIELRRQKVDLVASVSESIESCRSQVDMAGHELIVVLPDEPINIDADPVRLEQIIENLVNNAAKYTPPGGRIQVTVKQAGGDAIITVEDNGQGISPEMLPNIFEMFMQGDNSLDRKKGGLGIGLTLVRRLVELHAGSIWAESGGPGLGSCFTVCFPCAAEEPDEELPVVVADHEPASTAPLRVMVVDDNADVANSEALLFESCGYQVKIAYDGAGALEIAENFRPHVVVLDIGLPDMDGYQLARRLRGVRRLENACLVAISGYGSDADQLASRQAGIDHHFVKPIEIEPLRILLDKIAREPTGGYLA